MALRAQQAMDAVPLPDSPWKGSDDAQVALEHVADREEQLLDGKPARVV